MKKYILIIAIILGSCLNLFSQRVILIPKNDSTKTSIKTTKSESGGSYILTPKIPTFINPSPEASALTRYNKYPVGYNTGIIDINIPIWTVKAGNLNLPISIKFHPSGRKSDERESFLGCRWTLNAGGIITRTRRGFSDEHLFKKINSYDKVIPTYPQSEIYNKCSIVDENYYLEDDESGNGTCRDIDYKTALLLSDEVESSKRGQKVDGIGGDYNMIDSEYDLFSYVLPTGSGNFMLKDTVINGIREKVAFTIPYSPIKIKLEIDKNPNLNSVNFNNTEGNWGFSSMIIKDIDGTEYHFGVSIDKKSFAHEYMTPPRTNYDATPRYSNIHEPEKYVSAWHMTGIISANKQDTISFEYNNSHGFNNTTINKLDYAYSNSSMCVLDNANGGNAAFWYDRIFFSYTGEGPSNLEPERWPDYLISYTSLCVSKINYKNNQILFSQNKDTRRLDEISIKASNLEQIKKVNFHYSKDIGEQLFTLSQMLISDKNNSKAEKYDFDYYRGTVLNNLKAKDWWGYYNGKNNDRLVPNFNVEKHDGSATGDGNSYVILQDKYPETVINPIVNRDPDINFSKIGMLRSVTFPTGAKREFFYEPNQYSKGSGKFADGPGLRIAKVIDQLESGKKEETSYVYDNPDFPGYLRPNAENYVTEKYIKEYQVVYRWVASAHGYLDDLLWLSYRERTYHSDNTIETTGLTPNYITYQSVTEYHGGDKNTSNIGKTEYIYQPYYRTIREYRYTWPGNGYSTDNKYKNRFVEDCWTGWKGGELLYKKEYSKSNSNSLIYTLKKQTQYEYTDTIFDKLTELVVKKYYSHILLGEYDVTAAKRVEFYADIINSDYLSSFCHSLRRYYSAVQKISKITETLYEDTGNITTYKSTSYEPVYFLPKTEATNGYELRYKYPFNVVGTVYSEMVNRNIISPVIEKSLYKNSTLLQQETNEYFKPYENVYVPSIIKYKSKTNSLLEPRISFHNYDNRGNPLCVSKDGATKIVYLWSYYGQYPIAEIKDASYEEVKAALGWDDNYINSLSGKIVPSDSDMAKINGLRTLLPKAMVTTYVYKPLVGLTSAIDPRGIKTTYEYDDFGRLKQIKDNNDKLIEAYDYNYRNK